jgi:hypothetical protein
MASSKGHEETGSVDYCAGVEKALREAMGVFGDDSMEATIMVLKNKYGIRLGNPPCSSITEIENALAEITGTGADIIVSRLRSFMR